MNEVINDLNKELNKNEIIVIATSGGPDSMCLLNLLIDIRKEKNLKIICAHVNHKLRKESEEEAEMVKNFCLSNNITYEYEEIKDYKGNTEGYAREKRYKFFENIIKKYNAKYLLTAHHGDDLIETILMRISRGTDLRGLKGFTKITTRENYKIYRPLIYVTKDDILKYNEKNKISYAIDKTNEEDTYTRNRFRKYVLPPLKKENKNIHKNFIKLSNSIKEYEEHINKEKEKIINNIYDKNILNLKEFNKEDDLMKRTIIYTILEGIYKDNINIIKEKHVDQILEAIKNEKPNITVTLPSNKQFIKLYNEGKIIENEQPKEYDYILKNELTLPNGHKIKIITETKDSSNNIIKLSKEQIELPLHIRTRKKGDKMEVKGLKGSKKVKDIFIDEKIPAKERELYPILTDENNQILWIPGLKKSKFDGSKTQNYDIIIKYF